MKASILDAVKKGPVLMDGAIGTQVQAMGLPPGEPPERWNTERPDSIRKIHRDYLMAGARVLTTNSFGGHPIRLNRAGIQDSYLVNFQAAALTCISPDVWVAGSVGPCGEMIKPLGKVEPDEVFEGFKLQVRALLDGGADIILIETMTALEEALLAVEAARSLTSAPVLASMTFSATPRGFRTVMGVDIDSAVESILKAGADGVGSNCGNGIEDFIPIVRRMRGLTDKPILAEANAGMPEMVNGKTVYRQTPETMSRHIPALLEAGADLIGGCCGTTPAHIRKMKEILDIEEGNLSI
ncbi:MAG TPA: hypothetical protein ENN03_04365 [bacterium]|nr:hypothetical protein [bacterium]